MKKRSEDLLRAYIKNLVETAYPGNLGFQEMMKFYNVATPEEEQEMDDVVERGDARAFTSLIARVLKVKLNPLTVSEPDSA